MVDGVVVLGSETEDKYCLLHQITEKRHALWTLKYLEVLLVFIINRDIPFSNS